MFENYSFLSYSEKADGRKYIVQDSMNEDIPLTMDIERVLESLARQKKSYVYTWPEVLMDFDAWALKNNIPRFDDLADDTGKKKHIPVERFAYSYRDSDVQTLSRKFWVRTFDIRGRNVVRSITFLDIVPMLGKRENATVFGNSGWEILINFNRFFKKIFAGQDLLAGKRPVAWTLGSAARQLYFIYKYPHGGGLRDYQRSHPTNEKLDNDMRMNGALMGGLIYANTQKACGKIYKLDIRSCFPHIQKSAGEVFIEKSGEFNLFHSQIFKVKRLTLIVRRGCLPLYGNIIDYRDKWIFSEWLNTVLEVYDVLDMDIYSNKIYDIKKVEDKAVNRFVDNLFRIKEEAATQEERFIAKLFLNSLHGKFVQSTLRRDFEYKIDINTQSVEKVYKEDISDTWNGGHFDFIRGAYIYMYSNVLIMHKVNMLMGVLNVKAKDILYIDTDCIIFKGRDEPSFKSRVLALTGPFLGDFKLEAEWDMFKAFGPKQYFGSKNIVKSSSEFKIVCSGINNALLNEPFFDDDFAGEEGFQTTGESIYSRLTAPNFYVIQRELRRTANGGEWVSVSKKFRKPEEEEKL